MGAGLGGDGAGVAMVLPWASGRDADLEKAALASAI
jgi:hypothetical protein